jgi:hypothetical protein
MPNQESHDNPAPRVIGPGSRMLARRKARSPRRPRLAGRLRELESVVQRAVVTEIIEPPLVSEHFSG